MTEPPTFERTRAAQPARSAEVDALLSDLRAMLGNQAEATPPMERRLGETFEGRAQLYSLAIVLIGAVGALGATYLGADPTPFYALMASGGVSQATNAWLGAARQKAKGKAA